MARRKIVVFDQIAKVLDNVVNFECFCCFLELIKVRIISKLLMNDASSLNLCDLKLVYCIYESVLVSQKLISDVHSVIFSVVLSEGLNITASLFL